jgi:cysteine desulfurase / selenocysteine lyase
VPGLRVAATEVVATLREVGINTSVSRQDYARFDLESRGLGDIVRASVHYYNTEDEFERLCDALTAAYSKP